MATLKQDIQKSSLWLVKAFREFNKQLDYSVESVKLVDALIDEQFIDGKPKAGGLFITGYGSKVFAIGCYVGDTIIKNTPAMKWVTDDDDKEGEINVQLLSASGAILFPVQKAMKRISNGYEDNLYAYVYLTVNDI